MSLKDFEVYQLAISFLTLSNRIADTLPRGNTALKDQLKRASLSIVLNVAEGAGRFSPGQQRYHYMIARGSAFECYAAIEATKALGLCGEPEVGHGLETAERIMSILTRLCEGKRRRG